MMMAPKKANTIPVVMRLRPSVMRELLKWRGWLTTQTLDGVGSMMWIKRRALPSHCPAFADGGN
jgi:hypothetical protein